MKTTHSAPTAPTATPRPRKLTLARVTVRSLETAELAHAAGGYTGPCRVLAVTYPID